MFAVPTALMVRQPVVHNEEKPLPGAAAARHSITAGGGWF